MPVASVGDRALSQYFTPRWAAERLVERFCPWLGEKDFVVELSCGDGRFLAALPAHVEALGVEIDPRLAAKAAELSGREVLCGDFTEIELPRRPTVLLGNPPFKLSLFTSFLERGYELMEYGGKAGFITPCYFLQTAATVAKLNEKWSLSQVMLPRNLFQNMEKPIAFLMLEKSKRTTIQGFLLYDETVDLLGIDKKYRKMFVGNHSSAALWPEVVENALISLGGEASLDELYAEIEGKRPTKTQWWKSQIRKVARQHFRTTGPARYALQLVA